MSSNRDNLKSLTEKLDDQIVKLKELVVKLKELEDGAGIKGGYHPCINDYKVMLEHNESLGEAEDRKSD